MSAMSLRIPIARSKYGARKTVYDGVKYDSAAEAKQAQELDLMLRCKQIKRWERQVPYPIAVAGVHICHLMVDFRVWLDRDNCYIVEVKGVETAVYKLKKKLLLACYPDIDFRQVNV